jgi:hypothetical protein
MIVLNSHRTGECAWEEIYNGSFAAYLAQAYDAARYTETSIEERLNKSFSMKDAPLLN